MQGWKLYTSPTYKITVKYPADWKYDDTTQNFIIFTPQDTDPMGQVIPGIYFSILRENYADAVKNIESAFGTEQENINIGNLNGVHIKGLAGGAYILKNNDGKVFEFRYAVIDNFQEVARQIAESLRLL